MFVDDLSDFDMDEILQGSQKESEWTREEGTSKEVEATTEADRDEFEDEMEVMNTMNDDFF